MKKAVIGAIAVIIAAIITAVIGPLIVMHLTNTHSATQFITQSSVQAPSTGAIIPPLVNIGGNYSGTIDNTNYNVSARMTLIIQQSQNILEGSLTIDPPLVPGGGPISGSTSINSTGNTSIMFTSQYTVQSGGAMCGAICTFNFQGLLYTDGSLRGSYSIMQDDETGTWVVGK